MMMTPVVTDFTPSLELVHWLATVVFVATLVKRIVPRSGTCAECISGKFYAVLYGVLCNIAELRNYTSRKEDVVASAPASTGSDK